MNDETWFGLANFTQAPLQQTNAEFYCFQVRISRQISAHSCFLFIYLFLQLSVDGKEVYPVSPNARGFRQMTYPAELAIPPDYYPSTQPLSNSTFQS